MWEVVEYTKKAGKAGKLLEKVHECLQLRPVTVFIICNSNSLSPVRLVARRLSRAGAAGNRSGEFPNLWIKVHQADE